MPPESRRRTGAYTVFDNPSDRHSRLSGSPMRPLAPRPSAQSANPAKTKRRKGKIPFRHTSGQEEAGNRTFNLKPLRRVLIYRDSLPKDRRSQTTPYPAISKNAGVDCILPVHLLPATPRNRSLQAIAPRFRHNSRSGRNHRCPSVRPAIRKKSEDA